MATFQWSICEPDNPEITEMGAISKDDILSTFEHYPWLEKLAIADALADKAFYSPSLEFENIDNKHSTTVSIVGPAENLEYYFFYKRSIKGREHISHITGQTADGISKLLRAFSNEDYAFLETKC